MSSPKFTDHRDCPTVAVVGDDQPLGEYPPLDGVDRNPARSGDCARLCGAPGCASWGCLS